MSRPLADTDHYPVPAGSARLERTVQRSRFLAFAFPAPDRDRAMQALGELRAEHHRATHHCSALRLGHPAAGETWSSDDGEPSGSAGGPMLKEIQGAGLGDVMVVCARWFGGVKLGTGGLARAYGEAARAVLAAIPRETRILRLPLTVRMPWSALTRAKRILADHHALELDSRASVEIELELALPRSLRDPCREMLLDLLQGAGEVR